MTVLPGGLLIYGAYGYTGELTARLARAHRLDPVVAGRDGEKVRQVGNRYGFAHRAFALDDPAALDAGLDGIAVALHCAGPFSRTAKPMADACLRRGVHYLDITGELGVFESLAARHLEAKQASVMLMPGVGFDVVPSDCLAAHLKARLPDASQLTLAFTSPGRLSHGTSLTVIENLHSGGWVRRNGKLTVIPTGSLVRSIDYGDGPRLSMAIPWGDLCTAYHSTGIASIEVFSGVSRTMLTGARAARHLGWLLGSRPVQRWLKGRVAARGAGPSDEQRERGSSVLWGEVKNAAGKTARARLRTQDPYTLTALTSLEIARRVLEGGVRPGFQTPAMVFGADFITTFEGVVREDLMRDNGAS